MRHRQRIYRILSISVSVCLLIMCFLNQYSGVRHYSVYAEGNGDTRKEYEDEKTTAKAYEHTAELLSDEIKKINRKIAETTLAIENLTGEINVMDTEIEEAENLYYEYEDRVIIEKEKLNQVVSLMYETGAGSDEIAVILQSDDILKVLDRGEYLKDINDYYNDKISEYDDIVAEALEQESMLNNLRLEREEEIVTLEKKKEEMSAEIKELGSLMKEAQEKAEDAKELSNALAKKVAEMEAAERAALAARKYDGSGSNVDYSGNGTNYYYEDPYPYTPDELLLMAGIIEAEAGSVSYPGMVAVGSVVMNRVNSPDFGNTIAGVVYAPYQFEPAETGRLAMILAEGPADSCMGVAKEVLDGKRNVPNLYFKADWYAEEHGISGVNIGGNVFH